LAAHRGMEVDSEVREGRIPRPCRWSSVPCARWGWMRRMSTTAAVT